MFIYKYIYEIKSGGKKPATFKKLKSFKIFFCFLKTKNFFFLAEFFESGGFFFRHFLFHIFTSFII